MSRREHFEKLAHGEVHVWYSPTGTLSSRTLEARRSLLSREELERCGRLATEPLRRDFIVARALVRTVLSMYVDVPPSGWQFGRTALGKPIVGTAAGQELAFSLSHTIGLAACAVAVGREVGVDAEWLNRPGDLDSIARAVLTAAEDADVAMQAPGERRARILELWTLKEAYAKARGLGLSLPFDCFAFQRDGAAVRVAFSPTLGDDPRRWCFRSLTIAPEHVIAVAATRSQGDVRFRFHATPAAREGGTGADPGASGVTRGGSR